APEIVRAEVSADNHNAGVIHFEGRQPTVDEAKTAKNLLGEVPIKALNHITSLTLEFFESQAEQRRPTTLPQFLDKVRELVRLDGRPVKKAGYAGQVSRPDADKWASEQIREWKKRQRAVKEQAGENALAKVADQVKNRKKLGK
ncbi:MAG: RhuM family protein, partial [Terriglobia bacterium]